MIMTLLLAMQLTTATGGREMLDICTNPAMVRECAEIRVLKAKMEGLDELMKANARTQEALDVAREAIRTANYWKGQAQKCQDWAADTARKDGPSISVKPWCDSIGVPYNPKTGWCVAPENRKK